LSDLNVNPTFRAEDLASRPVILNVGAGSNANRENKGWTNCDLYPGQNIDVVFDAAKSWPFADNSVHSIVACHVLEHIDNFAAFFAEAWRVLDPKKGGLYLALPNAACDAGWGDPTHVQQWNTYRFAHLQPGYGKSVFNPQHGTCPYPFKVDAVMEHISGHLGWLCRWPLWQLVGHRLIHFMWNAITELKVQLKPLKTKEDVDKFTASAVANMIPVVQFCYQHEIEGRNLRPGEQIVPRELCQYVRGFSHN